MTNKWLDKMEEELNSDHGGCKVDNVLHCLGYKKDNHGCPPCEQCKKESQEIIAKIRKKASEQKQVVKEETSDASSETRQRQRKLPNTLRTQTWMHRWNDCIVWSRWNNGFL